MNLHFEDRQKLRALAQAVEPPHDLWPAIAARIDAQPREARRRYSWLAVAASFAGVAILAGAIGFQAARTNTNSPSITAQSSTNARLVATSRGAQAWHPADPRLRGAAVELHAAQGELRQALAIAPHSPYLQQLLDNTEYQQSRLRHLDLGAG